ncbi:hypothetical protein [Paenibacillus dakarensis]|uniref:hypothetical protein n=1 Tax=Paenibacillus dakarensis TaxID=1527293 RepID=UPI000AA429B2|nr:hypothetical protein [Paenibacillus dakarensis]
MNIKTEEYKIASLSEDEQTVDAIKSAEAEIASLSGKEVTLIAYEKTTGQEQ